MKKWMMLMAIAAAIFTPGLSFAGHHDTVVEFDELEGDLRGSQLEIEYTIDRRSWRTLRARDITPRLNLFVRDGGDAYADFAYSVELAHRKGRFEYPRSVRIRNGDRIEFEVVGYAGPYRVDGVRFDGETLDPIVFDIYRDCTNTPGSHPGHVDRDHDDYEDYDDHDYDRGYGDRDDYGDDHNHDGCSGTCSHCGDSCGSYGDSRPSSDTRVAIIGACQDAVFSSRVDQCVERASRLSNGVQTATIRACDDAFISDRDVLSCMQKSEGHAWNPAETVAACDEALISSRSKLSCLDKTRNSSSRPAPLVNACGSAVIGENDTLACIDKSRS
jgi:hypothetical protein